MNPTAPKPVPMLAPCDVARFWEMVRRGGVESCWLWAGATAQDGYGLFSTPKATKRLCRAHRVAYVLSVGAIPAGLCVLHRCDTRACVNPAHLFVGTNADNSADMMAKGRWKRPVMPPQLRGERHPQAKLTDVNRDVLREEARMSGANVSSLARKFGVSRRLVAMLRDAVPQVAC